MADFIQTSDKQNRIDTADSIANFNLVDIAKPRIQESQKQGPSADTDASAISPRAESSINSSNETTNTSVKAPVARHVPSLEPLQNSIAWQSKPLADIYEGGVFKLLSNQSGKEQFGLRISQDQDEYNRITTLKGRKLHDRMSLSFEYQAKF